ncbi:hypothetical protein DINM_021813 [Dirofilaria immitis]|nr:hypothetical protein [Dirofilaria immitis]
MIDWSSANDPFRLKYNNSKHHQSSITPSSLSSSSSSSSSSYHHHYQRSISSFAVPFLYYMFSRKNDSYVNESNQNFATINSSISDIVRALDDYEWSQTDENATLPSDLDLKGQISMETLDLIKRLHMQYLNTDYLMKQPESSSFGENKSKNEEIIHVSGKLEIL